jgi:hypothetical protein
VSDANFSPLGNQLNQVPRPSIAVLERGLTDEQPSPPSGSNPPASPLSWPTKALVALAFVKVVGATVMLAIHFDSPSLAATAVPVAFVVLQLLAFGGAGAVLLLGHARDSRTAHLGVVLLLVASAFATSHFGDLVRLIGLGRWALPLYPDAFLGYYLARFVEEFPRRAATSPAARAIRALMWAALFVDVALFAANAVAGWHVLSTVPGWLEVLVRRSAGGTPYWTVTFIVVLWLLPLTLTGLRQLALEERRRVRLFWLAFIVGLGPLVLTVVLGAVPGAGPRLTRWALHSWANSAIHLALVTLPVAVSYAVLVKRILPARVVIRQAVSYLFARWLVTAAFLLPVTLFLVHAYTHRDQTIAVALSGRGGWLVAGASLAGVALLAREDILRLVDRWFFREAYDAREVLAGLIGESRRVHRIDELVALVTAGIDRALRPESVAVLVRDQSSSQFVSLFGSVDPLPCSSVLAEVLGAFSEPLDVSLDNAGGFGWLPRTERQWLVDGRSRLLVPLRASDGAVLGLVTLGERKSELPFSREDRRLLQAIADSGALTIENHAVRVGTVHDGLGDWWGVGSVPPVQAGECAVCGRVQSGSLARCTECGGDLTPAQIPRLMFGKFQFERRVGRGAMGVVYEVTDLSLDRTVAIKTLPGTSPEHSQRLRLEAKAMAAVTHRNLATIHGAESWRGRPMLICEYMTHGTLASRLLQGVVPIPEVLSLGIALADALHVIHTAGLLHRDIKPSNIGFVQDWVPKLLDFGLVHMLTRGPLPETPTDQSTGDLLSSLSVTHDLVGTPLYLSPEATLGHRPTTSFDLWSLNVLLLEAITGQHPFRGQTVDETLRRIREGHLLDALTVVRGQSQLLAAHFERALATDPSARPQTAVHLADSLRVVLRS